MREIQIGQRHRKIGASLIVWRVVAVVPDQSGIRHCRVVAERDPTNMKLISEKVLADTKFYQPVAEE